MSIVIETYMDFGSGFGIKEGLNSTPQHPKPRTSIDDEHTVQRLYEEKILNKVISEYRVWTDTIE